MAAIWRNLRRANLKHFENGTFLKMAHKANMKRMANVSESTPHTRVLVYSVQFVNKSTMFSLDCSTVLVEINVVMLNPNVKALIKHLDFVYKCDLWVLGWILHSENLNKDCFGKIIKFSPTYCIRHPHKEGQSPTVFQSLMA